MHNISADNFRRETGHRRRAWYKLTGLFSKGLPKEFVTYKDCKVWGQKDAAGNYLMEVTVSNSKVLYTMRCKKSEGLIHVTYCEFYNPKNGYATSLLKYKLNIAQSMKFERIDCKASDKEEAGKKHIGYIVWGKLGFTMEEDYQIEFQAKNYSVNGRVFSYLHELLQDQIGEKIWEEFGFSWKGNFLLKKGSLNKQIFKAYLKRKRASRV